MKLSVIAGLAILTLFGHASTTRAANLLVNGSFELGSADPGVYATLSAGNPALTGWSVDAGSIDWIGTYWEAADGSKSLDLHGNTPGTLSQAFATQAGQSYRVRFALAGNPDGQPSTKDVRVTSGGSVEDFAFALLPGISRSNMGWTYQEFDFTALADSTTLSFLSTTGGNFYGAALDDVSVVAVPEPAAATLLALGALLARRRRSRG